MDVVIAIGCPPPSATASQPRVIALSKPRGGAHASPITHHTATPPALLGWTHPCGNKAAATNPPPPHPHPRGACQVPRVPTTVRGRAVLLHMALFGLFAACFSGLCQPPGGGLPAPPWHQGADFGAREVVLQPPCAAARAARCSLRRAARCSLRRRGQFCCRVPRATDLFTRACPFSTPAPMTQRSR
jgi:hypothetical protein